MQGKELLTIISDCTFCANYCYFDKPMFDYTEQQVERLFTERYSDFEIKKLIQLYTEYKALAKPKFKVSYDGDLVAVHLADNIRLEYYKQRNFCAVFVENKPLTKTFESDVEAKEYVLIYYPKFLLNKKHLIF